MKTLLFSLALISTITLTAQEDESFNSMVPVGFVVINSFDTYEEALSFMKKAAEHLDIDYELNGLHNEELDIPNTDTCGCGSVHGYYHRGRYDDGSYLSIERTSDYENLYTKKFVVFSGSSPLENGKSDELDKYLDLSIEIYKNAYIHTDEAYYGCMH